jgi:hypothetical protein
MVMSDWFIKDGRLTKWFSNLLFFGGLGGMGLALLFLNGMALYLALVVGLVIGSVSSLEAKARVLGLKPFTNDPLGWRAAKASYEVKQATCDEKANKE